MMGSSSCVFGGERQAGQPGADGQRAGVAHEDPRRGRVPPQEPGARAEHRGGDDGEVEGVVDVVDLGVAEAPRSR